jgi:hypothetical protein
MVVTSRTTDTAFRMNIEIKPQLQRLMQERLVAGLIHIFGAACRLWTLQGCLLRSGITLT